MPPPERGGPGASHASEIAPGVFVGGWADAEGFPGVRICVLNEAPEGPLPAEAMLPVYDPVEDAPRRVNLDRAVLLATEARGRGEPVLFFCGHGVRRGALAGAWYLHVTEGLPLDEAYRRVQAVRPRAEHVRSWIGKWRSELAGASRAPGSAPPK